MTADPSSAPQPITTPDPVLLPGLRLVERPTGSVTLVGASASVTLPDAPAVRRLVADLAAGRRPGVADPSTHRALAAVVAAGFTEPAARRRSRATARAAARVLVDAADATRSSAVELLLACGVPVTSRSAGATHVLLAAAGEIARTRVEDWTRRGVAHLLVVSRGPEVTVGPFVAPGRTCCVHCLDAHLADRDPDHPARVAALAAADPLSPEADPALQATALGWAVRDLVSAVDGDRPSTWSATVTLRTDPVTGLSASTRQWRRHPSCGCAWADPLDGTAR